MVTRGRHSLMWPAVLAMMVLFASVRAQGAELTAAVDRVELYQNEHVMLTLSLVDSDTRLRAEGIDPNIDLTLLSDAFDVGTPQVSHRFNIYKNRGRASSTLTIALFPKHSGTLTIPPFSVDGVSSRAITLHVLPARNDPAAEVFVRSGIDKTTLLQRETTTAWLDLYHRVDIKSARLGGPLDSEPRNPEIAPLPQTLRTVRLHGFDYQVTRSAWRIAAQDSGTLTLNFPAVWVETAQEQRRRFAADTLSVTIRALPEGVPALILIGRPEVEQSRFATALQRGELAPWSLTIRSRTGLNSLPDELPQLDFPAQIRFYRQRVQRRIDTSTSPAASVIEYQGYLMPQQAGSYTLPDIDLPYFDPASGTVQSLHVAGQRITVTAAAAGDDPSAIDERSVAAPTERRAPDAAQPGRWRTAFIAILSLWLLTLLLWYLRARARRQAAPSRAPAAASASGRAPALVQPLLTALDSSSLDSGLGQWQRAHGPDPELHALIRDIQRYYYSADGGRSAGEAHSDLEQRVAQAARRIRQRRLHSSRDHDDWSPRNFVG